MTGTILTRPAERPAMNLLNTYLAMLLTATAVSAHAQTLMLPERWRFTAGDSAVFGDPAFVDTGWTMISVPATWESQGYPDYDGFAWYRTTFPVDTLRMPGLHYLFLGKIDDADEVFLNGVRIGSSGAFPPKPATAWDTQRIYPIPHGVLRAKNVLAVRVYDMMLAGGITSGLIGLYNEKDYAWTMHPPKGPKISFFQPVTANGLIAAVYDERRGSIESVRPHIFQSYDSNWVVKPVLSAIRPTIDQPSLRTVYLKNTHIISVDYPHGVHINYFAPFTTHEKILYAVVRGPESRVSQISFQYDQLDAHPLIDSAFFQHQRSTAEKYYLFGFTDTLHRNASVVSAARERLVRTAGKLLQNEIEWMRSAIDRAHLPHGITKAERNVLEQSVSLFLMAQVPPDEIFPRAQGQILASLPPGSWNIAWVRDGMYSVLGLNRLGMYAEAKRFLTFCLSAESGRYVHYTFRDGKDYGVGVPYQISVTRYFGNGKEESDFNDNGPNIEFDDFGLFLSALCDYAERSGDSAFFHAEAGDLARLVADPIVHCIDTNDLMRQDSGPWERHLPGKQFTYTSIVCAAGLRDFAAMCERWKPGSGAPYRAAYEGLLQGIRQHMLAGNRLLKGNAQANDPDAYDYFDGGTFEAFAMGLLNDRSLFSSHVKAYSDALRMKEAGRGFARINKGDPYETAEWVLLDLRIASALVSFGYREEARVLIDWVTNQASLNFNLIPEIYAVTTGFYDGSIPMVGFGAGAYAVALSDFYGQDKKK